MDISTITSLIGSIGFPIVMCIMMFNYMKDEESKLTDAINELKNVITVLTERIERIDKKDDVQ